MSRDIARRLGLLQGEVERITTTDAQKRQTWALCSLPYLRAAWTMGTIDYQNPQVQDATGNGYALTNNNGSQFGDTLSAPYADFDGVNQNLSRADGGAGNWADILGTETYIPAAQRGLTLGGWFQFDRLTNWEGLFAKYTGVAGASSYELGFRGDLAGDPFQFVVSSGAALLTVQHTPSVATATGQWYYVVGRYTPSTQIDLFVGLGSALESSTLAAGIPAALNDSATQITIGSDSTPAAYLNGRASCCFLCAGLLSDAWIRCLYSQLRSIFRV
jgi:hypothetical protein